MAGRVSPGSEDVRCEQRGHAFLTRSPVGVNARLFHYGMGERGTRGGRARYETVWESPGFRDQVTEELRATGTVLSPAPKFLVAHLCAWPTRMHPHTEGPLRIPPVAASLVGLPPLPASLREGRGVRDRKPRSRARLSGHAAGTVLGGFMERRVRGVSRRPFGHGHLVAAVAVLHCCTAGFRRG